MHWRCLWALSLSLLLAVPAAADVPVAEFSGRGGDRTLSFAVRAPWLIEWESRAPPGTEELAHLEVYLYELDGNRFVGRVADWPGTGRGQRLLEDESGRFRFVIQGTAAEWRLRVYELTQAEAERLKRGE